MSLGRLTRRTVAWLSNGVGANSRRWYGEAIDGKEASATCIFIAASGMSTGDARVIRSDNMYSVRRFPRLPMQRHVGFARRAFLIADNDSTPVASIPCSMTACLPSETRCNCLPHPGKDVNAQRRRPWLWGQHVLTRRHAVSPPRCVERSFSDPTLRMRKPEHCLTTCTWSLTLASKPSSSSEAGLQRTRSLNLWRNSVTSRLHPSFTPLE